MLSGLIQAGRAAAEALQVDACTVQRQTGTSTDPNTGVVTPTYSTVYTGQCRVQSRALVGQTPDAGEHRWAAGVFEVQLPMSSAACAVDDLVTVIASVLDPELVGVVLRVKSLFHKSHATSRRLMCEEMQG